MDDVLLQNRTYDAARAAFRARTLAIARLPSVGPLHLARIHAGLNLTGNEPLQGALTDLFVAIPGEDVLYRSDALRLSMSRLSPHVAQEFNRYIDGRQLPKVNFLATRWSVLAHPSAAVPTRVRRAAQDDSIRMAWEVTEALRSNDATVATRVERAFLDYCISCHDKLAFMIASRELRRAQIELAERWSLVSRWLQQRSVLGEVHAGATNTSDADPPPFSGAQE